MEAINHHNNNYSSVYSLSSITPEEDIFALYFWENLRSSHESWIIIFPGSRHEIPCSQGSGVNQLTHPTIRSLHCGWHPGSRSLQHLDSGGTLIGRIPCMVLRVLSRERVPAHEGITWRITWRITWWVAWGVTRYFKRSFIDGARTKHQRFRYVVYRLFILLPTISVHWILNDLAPYNFTGATCLYLIIQ